MAHDDGHTLLPLACRFVPADLWLTTHVEYSWTVRELKHWLLTKCNHGGDSPFGDSTDVPRFRPASPVAFARATPEGSESEQDEPEASTAPATKDRFARRQDYISNTNAARDDIGSQYCLMSYSNGHILEDHQDLSFYPHELLELQRRNDTTLISRTAYLKPYFDTSLLVLKAHNRGADHVLDDANSHRTLPAASTSELRSVGRTPRKHRSGQWKERRLVIKDGRLSIWRERHDKHPMSTFNLTDLVALYPPDHVGLDVPCACADNMRCQCSNESGRTTFAVCARFTGSAPLHGRRRQERKHPGGNDLDSRQSSRQRTTTESARTADSSSETEYLVKDQLLVLRLPDERTYFNLLRILHYSETHFPLKSAFVSSKSRPSAATSPTSQSTPGSEPPSALLSSPEPTTAATALTSASESSPFPSVKLRKGAQRPSIVDRPSAESTSPDVTHRTLRYDNAHPSLAISVRYPNWRERILRRATHAGRARYALWQGVSDPNALTDSENEWDGWAYDCQGRLARRLAEEPPASLFTPPLRSPESASPSKLAADASRRKSLRPSRVRSEESLRTSGTHTPTPSIANVPVVQALRQETEPTPGKKRKLSISIFIPSVIPGVGTSVTTSTSTPRSLGRSRSSSAASALSTSMQQRLLQEPKRKMSSGNLGFGLNLRLGSQSKSRLIRRPSTAALDHPVDSEVKSRSSSVPAETVLEITADTASVVSASSPKTLSGSGLSTLAGGVKGALRKATTRRSIDTVNTSSTSSAGSSLGHTRSRSASTSAVDPDLLDGTAILLIPTPIVEVVRAESPSPPPSVQLAQAQMPGHGIGRLVRGLSFRK